MQDFRYQILEGKVAHEIIDGEVIILQFDTGFYFSMNAPAAGIWQWITDGASWSRICSAYQPLQPDEVLILEAFGERLAKENLVQRVDFDGETPAADFPTGTVKFEPPAMDKYGDMQDLLLADPIHEVDAEGWPKVAQNQAPVGQQDEPGWPEPGPQGG